MWDQCIINEAKQSLMGWHPQSDDWNQLLGESKLISLKWQGLFFHTNADESNADSVCTPQNIINQYLSWFPVETSKLCKQNCMQYLRLVFKEQILS